MWIKSLSIKNFRLFGAEEPCKIDNLNIPNGEIGSGITLFVGENGCGRRHFKALESNVEYD